MLLLSFTLWGLRANIFEGEKSEYHKCVVNGLCSRSSLAYYYKEASILEVLIPSRTIATISPGTYDFICVSMVSIKCKPFSPKGMYVFNFMVENSFSVINLDIDALIGNSTTSAFVQSKLLFFVQTVMSTYQPLVSIVDIIDPPYGQITAGPLRLWFSNHNISKVAVTIPAMDIEFNVLGIMKKDFSPNSQTIDSLNIEIEPGSWFFQLTPKYTSPLTDGTYIVEYGLSNCGYIEFVLSDKDIQSNRLFIANNKPNQFNAPLQVLSSSQQIDTPTTSSNSFNIDPKPNIKLTSFSPIHICIWGSNDMDGQKRIWLQQIESMDPIRFRFTWILSLPEGKHLFDNDEVMPHYDIEFLKRNAEHVQSHSSVVRQIATRLQHCRLLNSPYNAFALQVDELWEAPEPERPNHFPIKAHNINNPTATSALNAFPESDSATFAFLDTSQPAAAVWGGEMDRLYYYAHRRFLLAQRNVSNMSPRWCKGFYQRMLLFLQRESCDVLVYGNSR